MAITVDATSSGTGSNTTATFSHTVGATANLLVVLCGAGGGGAPTALSATYNGVAMTEAIHKFDGSINGTAILYLANPATGAHNIVITKTGGNSADDIYGGGISFIGANTSSPIGVTNSRQGGASSSTLTSTNQVANSYFVDAVQGYFGGGAPTNPTVGGGQTSVYATSTNHSGAGPQGGGSYKAVTTITSYSMSWTTLGGENCQCLAEIKPAVATGNGFFNLL